MVNYNITKDSPGVLCPSRPYSVLVSGHEVGRVFQSDGSRQDRGCKGALRGTPEYSPI